MWVKVDDALPDHPKVLDAGLQLGASGTGRVLAIWLKGMCYCNHNLTDGFIPERVLKSWTVIDRRPLDVASVMVMAGLFDREERGFRFHDYMDYQPSKAEVTAKRKKDLDRKRRRAAELAGEQIPSGFQAESEAVPATPSRPVPSLQEDHRRVPRRAVENAVGTFGFYCVVAQEALETSIRTDHADSVSNVTEWFKTLCAERSVYYDGEIAAKAIDAILANRAKAS